MKSCVVLFDSDDDEVEIIDVDEVAKRYSRRDPSWIGVRSTVDWSAAGSATVNGCAPHARTFKSAHRTTQRASVSTPQPPQTRQSPRRVGSVTAQFAAVSAQLSPQREKTSICRLVAAERAAIQSRSSGGATTQRAAVSAPLSPRSRQSSLFSDDLIIKMNLKRTNLEDGRKMKKKTRIGSPVPMEKASTTSTTKPQQASTTHGAYLEIIRYLTCQYKSAAARLQPQRIMVDRITCPHGRVSTRTLKFGSLAHPYSDANVAHAKEQNEVVGLFPQAITLQATRSFERFAWQWKLEAPNECEICAQRHPDLCHFVSREVRESWLKATARKDAKSPWLLVDMPTCKGALGPALAHYGKFDGTVFRVLRAASEPRLKFIDALGFQHEFIIECDEPQDCCWQSKILYGEASPATFDTHLARSMLDRHTFTEDNDTVLGCDELAKLAELFSSFSLGFKYDASKTRLWLRPMLLKIWLEVGLARGFTGMRLVMHGSGDYSGFEKDPVGFNMARSQYGRHGYGFYCSASDVIAATYGARSGLPRGSVLLGVLLESNKQPAATMGPVVPPLPPHLLGNPHLAALLSTITTTSAGKASKRAARKAARMAVAASSTSGVTQWPTRRTSSALQPTTSALQHGAAASQASCQRYHLPDAGYSKKTGVPRAPLNAFVVRDQFILLPLGLVHSKAK